MAAVQINDRAYVTQDGKLVGAVTHVFVGEPSMGYGIFAETMYSHSHP